MMMNQWGWLELCADRKSYTGVWKLTLAFERLGAFSVPEPVYEQKKGGKTHPSARSFYPKSWTHTLHPWELELIDWLKSYVKHRIFIDSHNTFYFENPQEAMLFKLTWS